MKVYQLLHFPLRGAGAGIYALDLARHLRARGHEVRVLRADHGPPRGEWPGETVVFASPDTSAPADLDFDFPVFRAHPCSAGPRFGALGLAQRRAYRRAFQERIAQGLRAFAPDVLHVHHGWVIADILAEWGLPYAVTLHGSERFAFDAFAAYRDLVVRGLARARTIMAVSQRVKQEAVAAYGVAADAVVVVPSGTDTRRFRPLAVDRAAVLRRLGVAGGGDAPVVLFAGRLIELKGVDVLLRAAATYERGAHPPLTLIAGAGDGLEALAALARWLRLERVRFVGQHDHDAMATLYNLADVVVVPSRMDTLPLVVLEALSCGTPVVASRVGAIPDVVAPGVGRLVEPDDPPVLPTAIQDLLAEPRHADRRAEIAAQARAAFRFERTVDAVERVYGGLASTGVIATLAPGSRAEAPAHRLLPRATRTV